MCFGRSSEQTLIIYIYSVKLIGFCNPDGVFTATYELHLEIQFRLIVCLNTAKICTIYKTKCKCSYLNTRVYSGRRLRDL